MILCLPDDENKQIARNELNIRDILFKTSIFKNISLSLQCLKCQKFGHHHKTCVATSKCQICALSHETKMHKCFVCKITNDTCAHIILKCVNCNDTHQANDSNCEIARALISKNNEKL